VPLLFLVRGYAVEWDGPENKGDVLRTPPLFSVSFREVHKYYDYDYGFMVLALDMLARGLFQPAPHTRLYAPGKSAHAKAQSSPPHL
jgi:hypothetical protein